MSDTKKISICCKLQMEVEIKEDQDEQQVISDFIDVFMHRADLVAIVDGKQINVTLEY